MTLFSTHKLTPDHDLTRWIWLAATSIALLPLFSVDILPLVDYPVHIVRQFILIHYEDMPALQAGYAIDWGIKPNLAMDAIVPTLSRWMSVLVAGRFYTSLVFLMLIGATCYLAKALHGKVGWLPLLSLLFLYNINFFEGYLNCLTSTAFMIFTFAVWIQSDNWQTYYRIPIIATLTILIFFSHLFPLAILVIAISAYEAGRSGQTGTKFVHQLVILGMAFIPVCILWMLKRPGPEISNIDYGPLIVRLHMWFGPALMLITSDMLILTAMFAGLFLSYISIKRNIFISVMRWPLLALFLISFFIPQAILGGSAVHLRLPVIIAFLAIASISPEVLNPHRIKLFALILITILSLRSLDVIRTWREINADFSELRAAAHVITPGARIMTFDEISKPVNKLIYSHVTDLTVLDRCVFVPHLAKIPDQQPIVAAKNTEHIDGGLALPVNRIQFDQGISAKDSETLKNQKYSGWIRPYFANWPEHFDYVLHIHDKGLKDNPQPELLDKLKTGSYFSIYRVKQRPEPQALQCAALSDTTIKTF